jgi:YHS domain-containing protein
VRWTSKRSTDSKETRVRHPFHIDTWLRFLAVLLALFATTAWCSARDEKPTRDTKHLNIDKSGLALEGYDPVAYFAEGGGKARKGDAKIAFTHQGVTYRFATEANKALFAKDPAKFEPQYGGWCAYAIPSKDKVEVDLESFVVRDGKLYLFYKGLFNDTRAKWSKDPADFVKRGDAAWKEITAPPKPKEGGGK